MSDLPKEYKKWIERVSNVVSFAFPFKWTDWEVRYNKWLFDNNIDEKVYLKEAQNMWTEVHNALEEYIINWELALGPPLSADVAREVEHGVKYLNSLDIDEIYTEKYAIDKLDRYQWTCDLLYKTTDGKWVLSDWKTFGICQKRFKQLSPKKTQKDGLPSIAKGKKDKVRLQMSLYAKAIREVEGVEVDKLSLLFVHENWVREVEFPPIPDKEIEELLTAYKLAKEAKENLTNKENINMSFKAPLSIIIQTSPATYGVAKVELNLKDLEGITPEEAINEACEAHWAIHKYVKEKYGN